MRGAIADFPSSTDKLLKNANTLELEATSFEKGQDVAAQVGGSHK